MKLKKTVTKLALAACLALGTIGAIESKAPLTASAKTYTYYAHSDTSLYKSKSKDSKVLVHLNQNQKFTTTTSKSSKYYKVKVGKKTGYIPKSKAWTKKTWYYYATSENIDVSKKRVDYIKNPVNLHNKKGAKFVGYEAPIALAEIHTLKYRVPAITYKSEKYYISHTYLSAKKNILPAYKYAKKAKKGEDYMSSLASGALYYSTENSTRSANFEKYLKRYGFIKKPNSSVFMNPYTYTKENSYGAYQYVVSFD